MPPRLVYVASIGRSGSTLLELLLGAHPDVATLGELHLWPHDLASDEVHLACGCGLPLAECPFWVEMRDRADPWRQPPPLLDAFREHVTHGPALRLERWRDFRRTPGSSAAIDTYASNTERVLSAFADLAEADTGHRPDVLVDASKDPYRLAWLVRSGRFDLTVLHLVRDPRGFVHSERKNVGDLQGWPLLRFAARKSVGWRLHRQLVKRASALLPPNRYRMVSYEALAAEPDRVVADLQAFIGVRPDPSVTTTFRDRRYHAVGGNPMRHRSGGIVLDERWRTELDAPAQHVTLSADDAGPAFLAVSTLPDGLRRTRFDLRMRLGRQPVGHQIVTMLNWSRVRQTQALVTGRTELVIDGFPSSGNSFAIAALKAACQSEARPLPRVAHHLHNPEQVRAADRRGIPILLLVRDPEANAVSAMTRWPWLTAELAVRHYAAYYEHLRACWPRMVVADFHQVTSDYAAVTRRLNERYDSDLPVFDHTAERATLVYDPDDPGRASRRALAPTVKAELERAALQPLLAEARALHVELTSLAGSGRS